MGSPEALEWERNRESTGFTNSSLELVEIHLAELDMLDSTNALDDGFKFGRVRPMAPVQKSITLSQRRPSLGISVT